MNEWTLFYLWATIMIMLYIMATSDPGRSKLLDNRFRNHIRSGFNDGCQHVRGAIRDE